jgi:hypothetical protein
VDNLSGGRKICSFDYKTARFRGMSPLKTFPFAGDKLWKNSALVENKDFAGEMLFFSPLISTAV